MLKSQAFGCSTPVAPATLSHVQRPLLGRSISGGALVPYWNNNNNNNNSQKAKAKAKISNGRLRLASRAIKAALATATEPTTIAVLAKVTVKKITGEIPSSTLIKENNDHEKMLNLEFASVLLDPRTGSEKATIRVQAKLKGSDKDAEEEIYDARFQVPADFGDIGAVIIENPNEKEMFVKEVDLSGLSSELLVITCNSWVQPKALVPTQNRVFFTHKSYLPSDTPDGLKSMREIELANLRGNGTGERQSYDRIYDYDVYNDLGDPDKRDDLKRPVLGGSDRPYPRRCRTGRPPAEKDPQSEHSTTHDIYVPRDENFSSLKMSGFVGTTVLNKLGSIIPMLEDHFHHDTGFPDFQAVDVIYNHEFNLPSLESLHSFTDLLPWIFKFIFEAAQFIFRFQPPEPMKRDKFFWLRDEEFARQTLAGLNPCSIQLVKEWPLKSQLDPQVYGPPESAFDDKTIDEEIGTMTIQEAISKKKLFILDYNDMMLPYVQKVRALEGTTLYGSRTLFFLNEDETLRPLAIELTRPPMDGKPQWKKAYGPSVDATKLWLWRFAKSHVLAHDAGYHQLVSHWLRTHCAVEPYVIATNRQLSAMHPIYRLLHPHFRYTMEINASARKNLISAGGTIESTFSPLRYSMELCSTAYDLQWQFDLQALPTDLIHRGLAEQDPTALHGLKLHIQDYPFANDGLILWDALKQWVTEYVNHYYPKSDVVASDKELQAWWTEIRTVGHADKKDETWWPVLNTPQDLIDIVTNMAWVASAHHAAVNFGQYAYAGYFPNRPSIARTNMPDEVKNSALWNNFLEKPEEVLLNAFPTQAQAAQVMLVLNVLSSHSSDEEYIGKNMEPSWGDNPIIMEAFDKFSMKMKELEMIIDHRNSDSNLKNRTGAGVTPYELLKPFSGPGVTGKGVPYSISI